MSATPPRPGRRRATSRPIAAVLACLLASSAVADEPEAPGTIVARRTAGHVRLDGRVDEDAWRDAPVYAAFVESFPRPGLPGSPRTEVRVLYDDETLFVAVTCLDPEPGAIVRQLARRDGNPTSDRVEVAIDSGSGGRSAYGSA